MLYSKLNWNMSCGVDALFQPAVISVQHYVHIAQQVLIQYFDILKVARKFFSLCRQFDWMTCEVSTIYLGNIKKVVSEKIM